MPNEDYNHYNLIRETSLLTIVLVHALIGISLLENYVFKGFGKVGSAKHFGPCKLGADPSRIYTHPNPHSFGVWSKTSFLLSFLPTIKIVKNARNACNKRQSEKPKGGEGKEGIIE